MKMLMKGAGVLAALALLAGCSSSSGSHGGMETVTVKVGTLQYQTKEITLKKGTMYKLVLENTDAQLHDFSVDKIEVKAGHSEGEGHHDMDMGGAHPDLHLAVDAGKSASIEFTPTKEGTYTYYCTVPGHKDAGMTGKLIVK